MSGLDVGHYLMPFEGMLGSSQKKADDSPSATPPPIADPSELLRMLAEANVQGYGAADSPKAQLERYLSSSGIEGLGSEQYGMTAMDMSMGMFNEAGLQFGDMAGVAALRNSTKTLKCPKCNWHYKYQETLEIHMKEKHSDGDVKCIYCADNRPHPKLARGESYSCGYKPYRCELCKYSTTTKGNLSIHMQSDKHLHAMQELPSSIASLSCPPSSARSPVEDGESTFVCLVCGCFSCDDLAEMIHHADKDRSRPAHGDVSYSNSQFRCHLCPYSTALKANFQLHTRTDKHLQRVQMVNHIREGATSTSALCRLNNAKSIFQVLCRTCQEILPSAPTLRDHCESVTHRTNLRQPVILYQCTVCPLETAHKIEAIGHMTCHEPSTWTRNKIDLDGMGMDDDAAYACVSCGFTTRDATTLEEHAKSHEEGEQCTLCTELTEHLVQEHKIAETAVERLLSNNKPEAGSSTSTESFSYHCPKCSMAFRSEASLQSHTLLHLFATSFKCPSCTKMYTDQDELKNHIENDHQRGEETSKCDLCMETFTSRTAILSHLNSVRHLHKAKKQLEQQGPVDINAQVLAALQQNPSSPSERKPFRCNVCKIGYGQGATLDIHLRSVAHQSRLSKIAELVATGEVDPSKPVIEQMTGPPQRLIRELLTRDDETPTQQQNVMTMFNIMNMLMNQNSGGVQLSFSNDAQGAGGVDILDDDEEDIPRNGATLLSLIEAYGTDSVCSFAPGLADKLGSLIDVSDDKIEDISRVDCAECGEEFGSIVSLKLHCNDLHDGIVPDASVRMFAEKLFKAIPSTASDDSPKPSSSGSTNGGGMGKVPMNKVDEDDDEPPEKRARSISPSSSAVSVEQKPDLAQMAMLSMMGGFNFMQPNPLQNFMPNMADFFNPMVAAQQMQNLSSSPAKRARTRITDDQLKILRQYFDINNSPTEAQIKEMSLKAGLPEKVIKHWFRNTLFKERQRDKDSPYNFNIPPQMSLDLDTYEKTGETKLVSLIPEIKREASIPLKEEPEEKKPSSSSMSSINLEPSPSPSAQSTSSQLAQTINIQAMMQQMAANSANPFQFMQEAAGMIGGSSMSQMPQSSSSSGRRANRTRFTDYQLRTLQQFFDKQAYPKDDDLEILSKKLQLSPRVIVVWFQNARQKARKIYENQPNHETNERFVRTPGCNFQCKRCSLVFQRYYELIQHQQKKCYKDDGIAQANDNKGVEENLSDEEKAQLLIQQAALASMTTATSTTEAKPADLLRLLGNSKSSTEALLKMCESAGATTFTPSLASSSTSFHKRCPFCGLLFRSRSSLLEHIPSRHPLQHTATPVDVDSLPNAEDVPVLIPPTILESRDMTGALDLSSNATNERESLSMSPFPSQSEGDETGDFVDVGSFSFMSGGGGGGTPVPSGGSRSPVNNKRYRTHLTPTQVHVMKCVFTDYKTPSMTECEMLGREIGLHKRVVQVWFQNARAKERKSRANNGDDEMRASSATGCTTCGVEYTGRNTLQDHLFTSQHLNKLKSQLKTTEGSTAIVETSSGYSDASDSRSTVSRNTVSGLKPSKADQLSSLNLMGFPFNLINGMLPGGLPMMYDTTLLGTPIPILQIPEAVQNQIRSDMAAGLGSTKFTQDGEKLEDVVSGLDTNQAKYLRGREVEVGWGCPTCTNVFQQESLLKNHQRTICQGTDKVFTLVQIHYECIGCDAIDGVKFGTRKEFQLHCESAQHKQNTAEIQGELTNPSDFSASPEDAHSLTINLTASGSED